MIWWCAGIHCGRRSSGGAAQRCLSCPRPRQARRARHKCGSANAHICGGASICGSAGWPGSFRPKRQSRSQQPHGSCGDQPRRARVSEAGPCRRCLVPSAPAAVSFRGGARSLCRLRHCRAGAHGCGRQQQSAVAATLTGKPWPSASSAGTLSELSGLGCTSCCDHLPRACAIVTWLRRRMLNPLLLLCAARKRCDVCHSVVADRRISCASGPHATLSRTACVTKKLRSDLRIICTMSTPNKHYHPPGATASQARIP